MSTGDEDDAEECLYEPSNPWFDPLGGSNLVPFVVLTSRLTALGKATEVLEAAVATFLDDERRKVDTTDFLAESDVYAMEAEEFARDELNWAQDVVPLATFGGLLAIALGALEVTAKEITKIVEMRTGRRFRRSQGAVLEQHLAFFVEATGQQLPPLTSRFIALRTLRNRIVHSLLDDMHARPIEVLGLPALDRTPNSWAGVVYKALEEVGAIATNLDEACERGEL